MEISADGANVTGKIWLQFQPAVCLCDLVAFSCFYSSIDHLKTDFC